MTVWWLAGAAFISTVILTGCLRCYANARGVLDHPNARSSHDVPTPRGGGLSVAAVTLASLAFLWSLCALSGPIFVATLGAGGLVAVFGWLDDHGDVPTRWRLLAHFVAAAWALYWLGGLPPLPFFVGPVDFGWIGQVLALLYLVWLLNLYNFMDGINGIAGVEAVTVCLGGLLLYVVAVGWVPEIHGPLLLGASVLGFLVWNFPRARIFLGDVGSGFIGVMLGVLSIQAAWIAPELFWGWVILIGAFVVDANVTLFRRVWRGETFYEAHRSHAYQYAARRFGSHVPVTLAVGAINLFWLLPLAVLVAMGLLEGIVGVFIAYGVLIVLCYRFKAGARELQEV